MISHENRVLRDLRNHNRQAALYPDEIQWADAMGWWDYVSEAAIPGYFTEAELDHAHAVLSRLAVHERGSSST